MKYEPVVGQIEQSMYAGRFDWEKCGEPVGVRPYISKTILGMIEVIAEVHYNHSVTFVVVMGLTFFQPSQ